MNEHRSEHRRKPGHTRALARFAWIVLEVAVWVAVLAGCQAAPPSSPSAAGPTVSPTVWWVGPSPAPRRTVWPTATPRPRAAAGRPTPTPLPTATARATATNPPGAVAQVAGYLYCRAGPGIYYPALQVLEPGQDVSVVAANKVFYNWRYVRTPQGVTCWVHHHWLEGVDAREAAQLPQITPPPPPPGAFQPARNQWPLMLPFCRTFRSPALQFEIKNLGPEPLRSFEVVLTVLDNGAVYRTTVAEGIPTCHKIRGQIPPGQTAAVAARTDQDLTDKRVRLDLRGCTQTGFRGACVAYSLTWTIEPPPRPAFMRP